MRHALSIRSVRAGAGQFGTAEQGIFSYWLHAQAGRLPLRYIGFGIWLSSARRIPPEDLTDLIIMLMRSEPSGDVIYNVGGGAIGAAPNHAIRLSSPSR